MSCLCQLTGNIATRLLLTNKTNILFMLFYYVCIKLLCYKRKKKITLYRIPKSSRCNEFKILSVIHVYTLQGDSVICLSKF